MPVTMHDILHPGNSETDKRFSNAPAGWTKFDAEAVAKVEGLTLTEDHWHVIRVIQSVHAEDQSLPLRMLHDALEAHFAEKGGFRYLFTILPGGPMVQGCRLAGLMPPHGTTDRSFGTVS
jgi:tRNA 2-thiouridine synthesizing protein E